MIHAFRVERDAGVLGSTQAVGVAKFGHKDIGPIIDLRAKVNGAITAQVFYVFDFISIFLSFCLAMHAISFVSLFLS